MLQQFGIVLQRFTVEPTAQMIAGGNYWQRFRNYWRVRQATKFLIDPTNFPIDAEGNLKPRDGQIEAKGYQVNPGEFVLPLLRLVLKLTDKHREQMLSSVFDFGLNLAYLGLLEKAIIFWDKAIEIKPDKDDAWNNRGNTLVYLGRYEQAIASWDKVVEIKPDLEQAWYNRARAYSCLGDIDTAIENLHQAINLNAECREIAKTDVNFDAIRNDERFMVLMEDLNSPHG